jgi:hypothetical protein
LAANLAAGFFQGFPGTAEAAAEAIPTGTGMVANTIPAAASIQARAPNDDDRIDPYQCPQNGVGIVWRLKRK